MFAYIKISTIAYHSSFGIFPSCQLVRIVSTRLPDLAHAFGNVARHQELPPHIDISNSTKTVLSRPLLTYHDANLTGALCVVQECVIRAVIRAARPFNTVVLLYQSMGAVRHCTSVGPISMLSSLNASAAPSNRQCVSPGQRTDIAQHIDNDDAWCFVVAWLWMKSLVDGWRYEWHGTLSGSIQSTDEDRSWLLGRPGCK